MAANLTLLQLNNKILNSNRVDISCLPSFLQMTSRVEFVSTPKEEYDLNSIAKEIEKVQAEEDRITQVLHECTAQPIDLITTSTLLSPIETFDVNLEEAEPLTTINTSVIDSTTTNSVAKNTSVKLKTKTDTTNLYKNLSYCSDYDRTRQDKIIKGGIQTLIDWLDNYINNYDQKVAEDKAKGHTEVKLSFLLRVRKAIENCDFPVGFGSLSDFGDQSGSRITLGAYSWSYYTNQYLNPEDNADNNVGISKHFDRSILFNPKVFLGYEPPYSTASEIIQAIRSGESVYDYDIYYANTEAYDKYLYSYFAQTLLHEFVHSTHITNEAVTYSCCELIEDDFRNTLIDVNYADDLKELAKINNIDLEQLTYGDLYIPWNKIYKLDYHNGLETWNDLATHGHDENNAYDSYTGHTTGNTLEDDYKQLMNFMV